MHQRAHLQNQPEQICLAARAVSAIPSNAHLPLLSLLGSRSKNMEAEKEVDKLTTQRKQQAGQQVEFCLMHIPAGVC
jgi:hypothetical protein